MKIRVTTAFNDRQNGYVTRPVNEVFESISVLEKEGTDIKSKLFFTVNNNL